MRRSQRTKLVETQTGTKLTYNPKWNGHFVRGTFRKLTKGKFGSKMIEIIKVAESNVCS